MKQLKIIATAVLCAALLVACGEKSGNKTTESKQSDTQQLAESIRESQETESLTEHSSAKEETTTENKTVDETETSTEKETSTEEEASTEEETLTEETSTEKDSAESTEENTEISTETADDGYRDIICREAEGFTYQLFADHGGIHAFSLELPDDWSFEKDSDDLFLIIRNGDIIGKITKGEVSSSSGWVAVKNSTVTSSSVTMKSSVEKSTAVEGKYRHRIIISGSDDGKDAAITLTAEYSEISDTTATKLRRSLRYKKVGVMPEIGMVDISDKADAVLILGNSFIGSSKVGYILQEMIDKSGRETVVHHMTRGYAHVDTYAYDEAVMDSIRNGDYAAVFINGYHNNEQAVHLAVMKEACDASGTELFMFPAHNEQPVAISYVQKNVEGVHLLHWKDEIQSFIDCGGDKWDFCINDAHLHSTPLAGYIGAHMIYRAIFGELPLCSLTDWIAQEYVDEKLPGYRESGMIYLTKGARLYTFG